MDVVKRLVVIPGFLCVKDLEDVVWGDTYGVSVFVEWKVSHLLFWLDGAQIKPHYFGHRIFLRWRGGHS